jgi:hypothetical protein
MLMAAVTDISKITGNTLDKTVDPSTMLRAQLNRFAESGAGALKLFPTKLSGTGLVDQSVSERAGAVMNVRLMYPSVGDDPAADRLAAQIITDFSGSVVRANLPLVIGTVAGFADAHGLPEARLPGQLAPETKLAIYGVIAVILGGGGFMYMRKRRQARG